jgi:hypothetical protein
MGISVYGGDNLVAFKKFCDYNERGLIDDNDLSKYKSFDQIWCAVGKSEMKIFEKDLECQIRHIYEDDTWLVLRPLTHFSSMKYGSATKWCTTMERDPDYFDRYTKEGILIYSLNKKTGFKVATHYHITSDDLTFWDQNDNRKDSMRCRLPNEILQIINSEITLYPMSNQDFLSDEAKEKLRIIREKLATMQQVGTELEPEPQSQSHIPAGGSIVDSILWHNTSGEEERLTFEEQITYLENLRESTIWDDSDLPF